MESVPHRRKQQKHDAPGCASINHLAMQRACHVFKEGKRPTGEQVRYLIAWMVLLVAGIVALSGRARAQSRAPSDAQAQTDSAAAHTTWRLVVDGQQEAWPAPVATASPDSVQAVARRLLRHVRRHGYYYAQVDSAVTTPQPDGSVRVSLYTHRGPRVRVDSIRLDGASRVPNAELHRLLETREGEPLDADRLEADIAALLRRYDAEGRPLAQVRVTDIALRNDESPGLTVALRINEGPGLWLKRIATPPGVRTSPGLLAHLGNLNVGASLRSYDPEALRDRLRQSNLFRSVGDPSLAVDDEGGATLLIPVREAQPGAFDVVLGYLPPSGGGDSGQLVGSGHLSLQNVFGGGRTGDIELDRRPGQVSLFEATVADPYVFNRPLRLEMHFRGEQRDSTYGQRRFRLDAGVRLNRDLRLSGSVSREVTRPGQAGTPLVATGGGRLQQQIPRAEVLFFGIGVHYERMDQPVNPRSGGWVDVAVEQGTKSRSRRVVADGDTTRESTSDRQERLQVAGRLFVPIQARQVLVVGGEASVLRSDVFDTSDLFRIGGASSLRGYDEDRFTGNVVSRLLVEHRLQLGRRSYAFAFGDLGFVQRPSINRVEASSGWHPGFGIGIQFDTALGLVKASYALSTEDASPANGRVHLGLSVGL